jgi:hypothetical protein
MFENTETREAVSSARPRGGLAGRGLAPQGVDATRGGGVMGYIIAWLLGVPVTLLVLFWLFFGS